MDKEAEIQKLESEIRIHNKKYFLDNEPEISDQEFDQLVERLKILSPTSPVLYELIGEIGNIEHPTPMLSLDKKYTHEDIIKWLQDINDVKYLVEPKYDGMAARYQNGILATRGDGMYGENISHRFQMLNTIGSLPADPSEPVSGEIIIPLSYFDQYLAKFYKNPRNAVVGIIKSKVISDAGIKAINDKSIHFVLHDSGKRLEVTQDELLDADRWEEILEDMFQIDYPLDGIVIKATSPDLKMKLGATQHHDKWQIAYKAPAERKITTITDIKDQVGRTGRITSVAVLEPVNLSGATVTNVTLHNYDFIVKSKIDIGDKVEICRSGEVIPFITKVIKSDNTKSEAKYSPPKNCPICNQKLTISGKYLECKNKNCPARLTQSMEYFFKNLNVEEMGAKTIQKLINELHIYSIADFYNITPEMIKDIPGFGAKSASNITSGIKNTLNQSITEQQLLKALGIKEIGPATSTWILKQYGFSNLNKLTTQDLEDIKGIGPQKAKNFLDEIHSKWEIAEALLSKGLKFKAKSSSGSLNDMNIAITGTLQNYKREDLIKQIESNCGTYKTSITKDVTHLIAGQNAGSKLQKATDLGIKIINENEIQGLFEGIKD